MMIVRQTPALNLVTFEEIENGSGGRSLGPPRATKTNGNRFADIIEQSTVPS